MNDLLEVFRTVPQGRVRESHEWLVTAAFTLLSIAPAVAFPESLAITMWPSVCLFAMLAVCMATDHLERPLMMRAAFLLACMVFHLAAAVPLFEWVGRNFMGLDALDPKVAAPCWAGLRAYAGFMVLTLGLRSSSLMVRWAEGSRAPQVEVVER